MGKNIIQQRRGRGSPRYRSPSHKSIGRLTYANIPENAREGCVVDILHSSGNSTPVAVVSFEGRNALLIAPEGMHIGQKLQIGSVKDGNICKLRSIPEGTDVFNLELRPGDGGRLCRSPGTSAKVVSRTDKTCIVQLPSKKQIGLRPECLATIGIPAGQGKKEKPFMKAGKKFYAMKAQNAVWPRTKAVAMNAVDHPLGGKTRPGKHLTVSRHAPPGAKYGSISPRRTGKKKK